MEMAVPFHSLLVTVCSSLGGEFEVSDGKIAPLNQDQVFIVLNPEILNYSKTVTVRFHLTV